MNKFEWEDRKRGDAVIYGIIKVGAFSISVHHQVHASPDIWYLSCEQLDIRYRRLESKELELAKSQALQIISLNLEKVVQELAVDAGTSEAKHPRIDELV